jgi:hypothetical protein
LRLLEIRRRDKAIAPDDAVFAPDDALPAFGALVAASLRYRLVGDARVIAAIGQALDGLAAAEEEIVVREELIFMPPLILAAAWLRPGR